MRRKGYSLWGTLLLGGWMNLLGCASSPSPSSSPPVSLSAPVPQASSPLPPSSASPFQKAEKWLREKNFARLLDEWKKLRGRASLLGKREYREIPERAVALLLKEAWEEVAKEAFQKAFSLAQLAEKFRGSTPELRGLKNALLEKQTHHFLMKALKKGEKGDFDQARMLVWKAWEKNPHAPEVLAAQGKISSLEGHSLYQRSQKILLESQKGSLVHQIQKLRSALNLLEEALRLDPGRLYAKDLSLGRERLSGLYFEQGRIYQGQGLYLLANSSYLLAQEMTLQPEKIRTSLLKVHRKLDPYLTRSLVWDTRGDGLVLEGLKRGVFRRILRLPYLAHFSSVSDWTVSGTSRKNPEVEVFRVQVFADKIKLENQCRRQKISSQYLEKRYQVSNPQYGLLRGKILARKTLMDQRALQIGQLSKKAEKLERDLKKNFVYQSTYQGEGTPELRNTVIVPRKLAPSQAKKRREKFKELYGYKQELKDLKALQVKEGEELLELEGNLSRQSPLLWKKSYRKYKFSEEIRYLFGSGHLKITLWKREKILFQKTFHKTGRWRGVRIEGVQKGDWHNYENREVPLLSESLAREELLRGLVQEAGDKIFETLERLPEEKLQKSRQLQKRGDSDGAREAFLQYLLLSGKAKNLKDLTKYLTSKRK